MKRKLFILGAFLSGLVFVAQAEVLAGYDFDAGDEDGTVAATESGAYVTASNFKTGYGLNSTVDTTYAPVDGLDAVGIAFGTSNVLAFGGTQSDFGFIDMADTNDLSQAIQANDYMEFTVTPDDDYKLTLSSLTFRTYVEDVTNSAERWALFSSLDSYLSGNEIATGQTADAGSWTNESNYVVVDLSADKFQDLDEAVTFRLYIYGGGGATNSATVFDKVVLNGLATDNSILVGYDFDADASDQSAATVVADDMTASQLTSPMSIDFVTTVGDSSGVSASGECFGSASTLGAVEIGVNAAPASSFDEAVAGDDYVTFTVTPEDGAGFHLTGLSFKAAKEADGSVDEYAVTDAAGNMIGRSVSITNVVGLTGSYDGASVDLTDTEYEFISEATAFRIYAWGGDSDAQAAIDKVALYGAAVNDSGRNSYFWVTLKPQAGTESGSDSDLVLANGYRSVNLSSSDLSCTRVDNGSNWVYQITWTGNTFRDDAAAETLQFNVVVEAFSDADYDWDAASVTSLGEVSAPTDIDDCWGVGTDFDLDVAESIRMTQQDFTVDGTDLTESGLVVENEFTSMTVVETKGGYGHKMIFGVGTNLTTASFLTPSETYGLSDDSFSVTGAGSTTGGKHFAISKVAFSLVVRNPELTEEDTDNPFSDIAGGHSYGATPYEPTTTNKLANAFPEFSWDRIPRTMLIRKGSTSFTDDEARRIANRYDFVVLEKANGNIQGYYDKATALKSYNPDIKVVFYWNSRIFYGSFGIDAAIYESDNYAAWIDPDYEIRGWPTYERSNTDFIDWWAGSCHKIMGLEEGYATDGVTAFQDFDAWEHGSPVDGYFIDKTGVPESMLQPAYEGSADWNFCMNNNGDNRTRIAYLDGTYREGYTSGGTAKAIAEAIAIARESGKNQKLTMLRNPAASSSSRREMEDAVNNVLGYYLAYAEKYAYFYHQKTVDASDADWQWITDYYDQFNRPLGEPLGDAIRDGWVYTRQFERCDLYLDLDTDSGGKLSRIMWKNDIGSPALAGSGYSGTDNTYTLEGGGNISGTADNFFYLSDLHYGNGAVSARLDELDNTGEDARAGILFRERNEPETTYTDWADDYTAAYSNGTILVTGARTVAVLRDPAGQMHMVYRSETDADLLTAGVADADQGLYAKLVRSGDTFTGYSSADGETWTEIAEVTLAMAEKVEMGLAVSSGDDTVLAEAVFSEFARSETTAKAAAQSVTVEEDASVEITLTGSDAVDSDLIYTVESDPVNGTLSGTAPNLTYTPDADYYGSDSFTFSVNDGFADSDTATVSITVEAVNDAPVFDNLPVTSVRYDGIYSNSLAGAATDADGDSLTYSILSGPDWLSIDSEATLSGTPGISNVGTNCWVIQADDGNDGTATTNLNITVVDSILIGYDFDSDASDMSAVTLAPTNVTASSISSPMDISYVTTGGDDSGVDAAGSDFGRADTLGCVGIGVNDATTASFDAAVTGNDYLSFTLTPADGVTLTLYSITFKATKKASGSVDRYALADADGNMIGSTLSVSSVEGLTATYQGFNISLVDTDYQTISAATEFRIYAWGRGTTATANTIAAFDKLTVYGSTEAYSAWSAAYGWSGDDMLSGADADNDGYANLVEYALGMNPTNSDAGSMESLGTSVVGGTNYFEYVHYRLSDYAAQGVTYLLLDSTNLLNACVSTNAQDQILVGPEVDGYESVTNRYLTGDSAKFIQLQIQQE